MVKILFDDKSYIEVQKSIEPDKIFITIGAQDAVNPLKKIVNSVEISSEQFKKLIADIK
jgi:lysophospholipase L1-like esterase